MRVCTALSKDKLRRAQQKILKIGQRRCGASRKRVGKENLAVKHLRERLIQVKAVNLPTNSYRVISSHPAEHIVVDEIVLHLGVVAGAGADLEARTSEGELVDGLGDGVHRPIDAQV